MYGHTLQFVEDRNITRHIRSLVGAWKALEIHRIDRKIFSVRSWRMTLLFYCCRRCIWWSLHLAGKRYGCCCCSSAHTWVASVSWATRRQCACASCFRGRQRRRTIARHLQRFHRITVQASTFGGQPWGILRSARARCLARILDAGRRRRKAGGQVSHGRGWIHEQSQSSLIEAACKQIRNLCNRIHVC